ncbi:aconitate hydratase AcnA [Streptomyces hirsutus]
MGGGGIEATAAALGQAIMIRVPHVVGVELTGRLAPGVFASDLALTLAERLRELNVVGSIVEFHGPGLSSLSVPDRATVANMAPEYGATMAWFPADRRTIAYLATTGRPPEQVHLTEQYLKAQGLLHSPAAPVPRYDTEVTVALDSISTTLAGPARPHEALSLAEVPASRGTGRPQDGDVAIAAITSCTNTSNPRSLVAAGLLARNAVEAGLRPAAWTKTSTDAGLQVGGRPLGLGRSAEVPRRPRLPRRGIRVRHLYGQLRALEPCPRCDGAGQGHRLAAVLSGNRNFTGRIHPEVAHAYLASPAMVVAYALAGNVRTNLEVDPLGHACRRLTGHPCRPLAGRE